MSTKALIDIEDRSDRRRRPAHSMSPSALLTSFDRRSRANELNQSGYFDLLVFGPDSVLTGLGLTRMAHYDGSSWSALLEPVPPSPLRRRKPFRRFEQEIFRLLPAHAPIRNGYPSNELSSPWYRSRLTAFLEIAFQHHPQ